MAIIWTKLIPRWSGDTIEPPEAKKDTGYFAGDKPPAKWENWLRKGTYEALDETRDVIEGIDSQLAQKANKQQQSWVTPTLLNGWVDYVVNLKCGYYKDDMGIVRIRGSVKSGVTTQGTPIFTLPEGDRPSQNADYRTINQDVVANVRIYTNGNVSIISGSATLLSLDGITFRAEG